MESFLKANFTVNIDLLKKVLLSPAAKKNPADALYHNKSRTVLFRLEALSRICRSIYGKKIFKESFEAFKSMEDGLGAIEYYDDFCSEFSLNKSLPKKFVNYYSFGIEVEKDKLNKKISENNYCSDIFLKKINTTLSEVKWLSANDERNAFINFLIKQCRKIREALDSGELNFSDLEGGVHEVRRKIRWLSIYAAVVNGIIQLKKNKVVIPGFKNYLTPEIINLPFNKMPPAVKGIKSIYIQSDNFYALSWIINELGILKDEGLRVHSVGDILKKSDIKDKNAIKKTLLNNCRSINVLCETAEKIVDEFIYTNGVLDKIERDLKRSGEL